MKNTCKIAFLLLAFISHNLVYGQTAGSRIWYFGNNAGVDFTTSPPTALTNGQVTTDEGCAAVSDEQGNLFFYTDGRTVYDRNHGVMSNGSGLNGNPSSTQSAVAVGDPGNSKRYYLFTVDAFAGTKGLCYSIIDMTKNGGLGQVVTKNVLLRTPVCEKVTAVRKPNSNIVWIVTRGWENDSFYTYKLDSTSCKHYRSQAIGSVANGTTGNSAGYLKANIAGTKICYASYMGFAEMFDFNPVNANFSNTVTFSGLGSVYGVEFSKNNKFLYLSNGSQKKVWQYDITQPNAAAIVASQVLVSNYASGNGGYSMQLAPDGKIYLAIWTSDYLACIPNPDSAGTKCGFIQKAIDLQGKICKAGLPNSLNSDNFKPFTQIRYKSYCPKASVQFSDSVDFAYDSAYWFFGWHNGKYAGFSKAKNPEFTYKSGDSLTVKFVVWLKGIRVDSAESGVEYPDTPVTEIQATICNGDSFVSNGMVYKQAGVYTAIVNNSKGCDSIVKLNLTVRVPSRVELYQSACENIGVDFFGQRYYKSGDYTQKLVNYVGCDSTIVLHFTGLPQSLTNLYDTICFGQTVSFNGSNLSQSGVYKANLTSYRNCDSLVNLYLTRLPQLKTVFRDTFCHKDSFVFFGRELRQAGTYQQVLSTGSGCDSVIQLELAVKLCHPIVPCQLHFPSAFTPDGNNINDGYKPLFDCNITGYEFKIFNRWGQQVFNTESATVFWDGTYGGKPAPQGMYIFRANITAEQSLEPEKHRFEGTFLLVR